jgi:hypothetical protein
MRAAKLIRGLKRGSLGVSLEQDCFNGYEQKLTRWGCSNCESFEKRHFKSGLPSEELDAYMICRFAGELIDLLGEVTVCPKNCRHGSHQRKSKSGQRRLYCVCRA